MAKGWKLHEAGHCPAFPGITMHLKIPPVLLAAFIAAMMYLFAKVVSSQADLSFSFPYQKLLIISLVLASVAIVGSAIASFRLIRTTVNPTRPGTASTLVVEGIYRFSRNPMYLGVLLVLIAWGVYLGNLPALVFWPAVFVVYMNKFQIGPEERALGQLFGDDFQSYRNRVRRWM